MANAGIFTKWAFGAKKEMKRDREQSDLFSG